jgi:predicted RNase H-like HicB family nuclease
MATYLQYLNAALKRAEYERLEDGGIYAHIAGFEGLWPAGASIEEARAELYDALDGWLTVNAFISKLPLPDIGVRLTAEKITD